jgi:predicted Zn-dependent peptidase
VTEVLAVVRGELGRLAAEGISPEELERGKGQLRGGLVLALEDSASRMARIAKAELLYDELPSLDEVIRRVDEVTLDDVGTLARTLFKQDQTLAVVGPFDRLPV